MAPSASPSSGMPKPVRIVLIGLGLLIGLVVLVGAGVFVASNSRIDATHEVSVIPMSVEPAADMIERGKELATFRGCRDCHGSDLAGRVVADAMPVMLLAGPNITPGGVAKDYSNEDWARTVRHGIKPDKRSVLFMPSYEYTELSHEDFAAIVAYAKSVPAVDKVAAPFEVGPLGRVLLLAGELPLLPAEMVNHAAKPATPTRGPTKEYGKYLASACIGCHGDGLSGGPIPGVPPDWPPAGNLTSHETGLGGWTFEQFSAMFKTGKRPDGTAIKVEYMPIALIAESATEDDLRALWAYMESVPPKPRGGR